MNYFFSLLGTTNDFATVFFYFRRIVSYFIYLFFGWLSILLVPIDLSMLEVQRVFEFIPFQRFLFFLPNLNKIKENQN